MTSPLDVNNGVGIAGDSNKITGTADTITPVVVAAAAVAEDSSPALKAKQQVEVRSLIVEDKKRLMMDKRNKVKDAMERFASSAIVVSSSSSTTKNTTPVTSANNTEIIPNKFKEDKDEMKLLILNALIKKRNKRLTLLKKYLHDEESKQIPHVSYYTESYSKSSQSSSPTGLSSISSDDNKLRLIENENNNNMSITRTLDNYANNNVPIREVKRRSNKEKEEFNMIIKEANDAMDQLEKFIQIEIEYNQNKADGNNNKDEEETKEETKEEDHYSKNDVISSSNDEKLKLLVVPKEDGYQQHKNQINHDIVDTSNNKKQPQQQQPLTSADYSYSRKLREKLKSERDMTKTNHDNQNRQKEHVEVNDKKKHGTDSSLFDSDMNNSRSRGGEDRKYQSRYNSNVQQQNHSNDDKPIRRSATSDNDTGIYNNKNLNGYNDTHNDNNNDDHSSISSLGLHCLAASCGLKYLIPKSIKTNNKKSSSSKTASATKNKKLTTSTSQQKIPPTSQKRHHHGTNTSQRRNNSGNISMTSSVNNSSTSTHSSISNDIIRDFCSIHTNTTATTTSTTNTSNTTTTMRRNNNNNNNKQLKEINEKEEQFQNHLPMSSSEGHDPISYRILSSREL